MPTDSVCLGTNKANVTTTLIGSERFGFGWRASREIILCVDISLEGGNCMERASKITSFFLFPAVIFLVHLGAKGAGLYEMFPKIDIPFHYLGGLSIAYTCAQLLAYLESEKVTPVLHRVCLLYTSPSPRDRQKSRMPSSA